MTLHYSDVRVAMEHTQGTGGTPTLNDADHPIHADPVFVSSTDYSEAASSPTIDAGTADPASGSLDLTDLPRTIGPAIDMGATEFAGAAPTVTTGGVSVTGPSTATLTGGVAPGDQQTTWYFNYGTTAAYGSTTPVQNLGATMASQPVSAALGGARARHHLSLPARRDQLARAERRHRCHVHDRACTDTVSRADLDSNPAGHDGADGKRA